MSAVVPNPRRQAVALLLALAVLPSRAFGEQALQPYLAMAARYASGNRTEALQEIRKWSRTQIKGATAALRREVKRLRSVARSPDEIDFRAVEAAVLLHAEAGLLCLQERNLRGAKLHLDTAVELQQWSAVAAAELRNWASLRRHALGVPGDPRLEPRVSIDDREFFVALAAGALALGYAEMARPAAERASRDAPLAAEVQLLLGCVASGLATEKALQHHDSDAARARDEAERAFREALALDPETDEARLRLGKLLLDEGRVTEAEPLLAEVEAKTTDERRRYLALLFLGRAAERRGDPKAAVRSYRRAHEAWPDSQASRLGLAHALENASGPDAAHEIVAAALDPSRRRAGSSDPWFVYFIGPPGLAQAAFDRVWGRTLRR